MNIQLRRAAAYEYYILDNKVRQQNDCFLTVARVPLFYANSYIHLHILRYSSIWHSYKTAILLLKLYQIEYHQFRTKAFKENSTNFINKRNFKTTFRLLSWRRNLSSTNTQPLDNTTGSHFVAVSLFAYEAFNFQIRIQQVQSALNKFQVK